MVRLCLELFLILLKSEAIRNWRGSKLTVRSCELQLKATRKKALNLPKAADSLLSCQHPLLSFYASFFFNGAESFQTCCSFQKVSRGFLKVSFHYSSGESATSSGRKTPPQPPQSPLYDYRMHTFFTPSLLVLVLYWKRLLKSLSTVFFPVFLYFSESFL